MRTRYLTLGSLGGLAAGVALGLFAHLKQDSVLLSAARFLEPFGELWTNVLGLVVTPMIVVSIVLAVLSFAKTRSAGRFGMSAILIHTGILTGAAVLTVAICLWIVPKIPVRLPASTPGTETAAESGSASPASNRWKTIVSLEPVMGPVRDHILAVIGAAFLLALAFSRIAETRRNALLAVLRKASEKLTVLLNGILLLIPIAVFSLSFALAAATGLSIAGVVVAFIVLSSALLIAYTLGLYPLAAAAGHLPLRTFAAALWPSQAVAAGTRSSLACLPTLLEGAAKLELPRSIAGIVLPLSVSTFKLTRAVSSPLKLIFLAHVYGIGLEPSVLVGFVLTSLFISFTTPGVPSGGSYAILPLYLAAGIPLEGIVLLKSVDAVPDIFKTILHVSESLTITAIVSRKRSEKP